MTDSSTLRLHHVPLPVGVAHVDRAGAQAVLVVDDHGITISHSLAGSGFVPWWAIAHLHHSRGVLEVVVKPGAQGAFTPGGPVAWRLLYRILRGLGVLLRPQLRIHERLLPSSAEEMAWELARIDPHRSCYRRQPLA